MVLRNRTQIASLQGSDCHESSNQKTKGIRRELGKPLVNCARNCRGLTYIETLSFDLILASDLENYEIKLTSCV